ncbi:efflux RND transporter periplasmic adaptor subunit [Pseudomonas abyssi]|nr:efflux RND transporter periplasmic adaptor subunit [Halopseudomonas gallaeciensis]
MMVSAAIWQGLPAWCRAGALAVAVLGLVGCRSSASESGAAMQAVPVRVAAVTSDVRAQALHFAGVARARQRASLTFQVGGTLATRPLEIGQQVVAGQVLATLYNPQLEPARDAARARLAELQAQSAQARRDVQRTEQLFERGVLSQADQEQQRARLQALEAGVRNARAALQQREQMNSETRLRAPFDGSIDALLVEPGEFVAAGQPVLQLAAGSGLEVEVLVPASLLQGLEVGATLPVWSSLDGQQWQGRVAEVGRGSGFGSSLYPLVVSLPGGRAGDAVEVGLQPAGAQRLSVPLAAVMRSAQGLSVFRVVDTRAERVAVTVAGFAGEQALLSGDALAVGDQVVYAGLSRLADGDAVELLP